MESLLAALKRAQEPGALHHLGQDELREIRQQLDRLTKQVRQRMLEVAPPPPDSDPDYIDVVIDGKLDQIKKDIKVLNISCNSLERLPDAIYQLKSLKKLYLFNNSFSPEEKENIRHRFPGVHIYF